MGLCAQWRQERSAGPRFRRLRTEDTTSDTSAGRLPDKALIHLHRPLPGRPPGRDERLYEIWVHPRRHLPSLCDSGLSYKMETDLGGSSSDSCRGPELGPSPAHHPPAPPLGVASPTRPPPTSLRLHPWAQPRPHPDPASPRHSPAHQPPAPPLGATRRRRSKVNPTITYLALFSRPLSLACRPTGPAVGPCSSTRPGTKCPNTVLEITSSCTR